MMNFLFGTNGKLIILGVPILKHIRVYVLCEIIFCKNQDTNTPVIFESDIDRIKCMHLVFFSLLKQIYLIADSQVLIMTIFGKKAEISPKRHDILQ